MNLVEKGGLKGGEDGMGMGKVAILIEVEDRPVEVAILRLKISQASGR